MAYKDASRGDRNRSIKGDGRETIFIDHKTFECGRGCMERVNTVVLKERKRGFQSSVEIDEVGISWIVRKLKEEAEIKRVKREEWNKVGKFVAS